jgi:hypothetical protein
MRPESIILFEKVFFASLAVGIATTVIGWEEVKAMLADPSIQAAGIGGGAVALSLALGIVLPLVLWYFIARRASNVAKWIFVVLTALGLFGLLAALADPSAAKGLQTMASAVSTGLQVAAAWLLFRPDARKWLEGPHGPNDPAPGG